MGWSIGQFTTLDQTEICNYWMVSPLHFVKIFMVPMEPTDFGDPEGGEGTFFVFSGIS